MKDIHSTDQYALCDLCAQMVCQISYIEKDTEAMPSSNYNIGDDFNADMDKMSADPVTRQWWYVCKPCQVPFETREEGEWWAEMEEVFYCE